MNTITRQNFKLNREKAKNKTNGNFNIAGKINRIIGTGDNAKHSIAYYALKMSFWVLIGVIFVLTLYSGCMIYLDKEESFIDNLLKGCGIITPIITLLLGYTFADKNK